MTAPAKFLSHDRFRPGPLWSLWDMLRQYGYLFHALSRQLQLLEHACEILSRPGATVNDPGIAEKFGDTAKTVETLVRQLGLKASAAQATRISGMVDKKNYAELKIAASELSQRISDELDNEWFFYLKLESAHYYADKNLFGDVVADKFQSAVDDIEGAGKCLAFGLGTATVFHLMRVMEVGLKALGKALGIPYAPSWESYLKQINDRIAAKHKTKGIAWKKDEPFYRDLAGDLQSVKIAWRNPTMHVVKKYTREEAEEIFHSVRTFMKRLASRVNEKGKPA